MIKKLLHRRGTTQQIQDYRLDDGEIVINTDTRDLHVGDGITALGTIIPCKTKVDALIANTIEDNFDAIADKVVSVEGAQNINGVKNFQALPESQIEPSKYTHFVNKRYADTKVSLTDDETITGTKTFTSDIIGNIETASKLQTPRIINVGDLEFQGSAVFDGTSDINLNITQERCNANVGNANNYPFHRIAYSEVLTSDYSDKGVMFLVERGYNGGGYGIFRVMIRTNQASTGATATCEVQWLARTSTIPADCIQVGFNNSAQGTYADVFYKSSNSYASAMFRVLTHIISRTTVNKSFTLVNSTEVNDTTEYDPKDSIESYSSIAFAGSEIRNQEYTSIITAQESGVVNTSNVTSKVQANPNGGSTYVGSAKLGGALVNSTTTTFGTVWNSPTKNYRVGCATYPSSGDQLIWYSVSNANINSNTNTATKQMTWDAGTGNLTTSTFTGNLVGNVTGNATTSSKVVATAQNDTVVELVRGTMATNDQARLAIGGASDQGYLEIATGDNGNDPIHVRQYSGGNFATVTRTATLLDASGNTSFPNTVTANYFVCNNAPTANNQLANKAYVDNHAGAYCTTQPTTTSTATANKPAVVIANYKNGTSWYRQWSDGWLEQGGRRARIGTDASITVTLVKAFGNTNYHVLDLSLWTSGATDKVRSTAVLKSRTSTNFVLTQDSYNDNGGNWYACGYMN